MADTASGLFTIAGLPDFRLTPIRKDEFMAVRTVVNVAELVDEQVSNRFHTKLIALCAAIVFIDGFDNLALGYVAPVLVKTWHLTPHSLAPVFVASQIGIVVGAMIMGPVADRFGRKPLLVLSTTWFGIMALVTATATSLSSLLLIRLIGGLALGGAMPNAVALTAEWSPRRNRTSLVTLMFCGFALGSAVGGTLAASLMPFFGWQSVFLIGGVLPIVLAIILVVALPESIRLLAARGTENARIRTILARLQPHRVFDASTVFIPGESHQSKNFSVADLFTDGRAGSTILLWVMLFASLFEATFLLSWLPTFMHRMGLTPARAAGVTVLVPVGGILGALLIGKLLDRRGAYVFTIVYIVGATFIVGFSATNAITGLLVPAAFGTGFCIIGAQMAGTAFAGTFYPTVIRSSGVGWALGVGRVGSIVAPILGGVMLSLNWSTFGIFAGGAIPPLVAAAAALGISRLCSVQQSKAAAAAQNCCGVAGIPLAGEER
jgi:AAHS family 4-hydroxybenzoate transporter-like MFS transporter